MDRGLISDLDFPSWYKLPPVCQAADVNLSPPYLPRIYSLSTPPCHPTENAKISMTSRTNKFCLGYKHTALPIKGVKRPFFLWERPELLDFRAWAVQAGPKQSLSSSCIVWPLQSKEGPDNLCIVCLLQALKNQTRTAISNAGGRQPRANIWKSCLQSSIQPNCWSHSSLSLSCVMWMYRSVLLCI